MSAKYRRTLDRALGARLWVEFTTQGKEVTDCALALLLKRGHESETIRLYDGAHGHNEMHRYGRISGKQPGTPFHGGTLGEGMRAAIEEAEDGYAEMIEGWERQ
jgi:hypothetical protein